MMDKLAFVGDVHGELELLESLWQMLEYENVDHVIFLGDYINKGPRSSEVLEYLLNLQQLGKATLLAGNHEAAFLEALDTGILGPFLKMGGAITVRSYVKRSVKADVAADIREHVRAAHVEGLRAMPDTWENDSVIARHAPLQGDEGRFSITAHIPVGPVPVVSDTGVQIDTSPRGNGDARVLTAFLWPGRAILQAPEPGNISMAR